jgi:hypothetical protein
MIGPCGAWATGMADTKRNANHVGALDALRSVSVAWTDGVHGAVEGA